MKVKDVMTKEVVSVKADDRIMDVLKLLFEKKMSGLPLTTPMAGEDQVQ